MPFDRIEDITRLDLEGLLNVAPERKRREYKRDLPGDGSEARKEFISDVSSFANGDGGYIFFGIEADAQTNMPTNLAGIPTAAAEAAITSLENRIRDNCRPRLPTVQSERIPLADAGRCVLAMYIAASRLAPHQNTLNHRFYGRNTTGKYPLEATELTDIILNRQSLPARIRAFRHERLALLQAAAEDAPTPIEHPAKLVLHFVAESTFDRPDLVPDLSSLREARGVTFPADDGVSYRYNLDGLLFMTRRMDITTRWYAQVYYDGTVEIVNGITFANSTGESIIYPSSFETDVFRAYDFVQGVYEHLRISGRVIILVSALGIRGYRMAPVRATTSHRFPGQGHSIGRDPVPLNEVVVEDMAEARAADAMHPVVTQFWRALDFESALSYRADGTYVGQA